jgi:ribose 5-phosphate isomerase B
MKIYIGADHNGFELKKYITDFLEKSGHQVIDEGDKYLDPDDDFPEYASRVVSALLSGDYDDKGILICGSGQGMCMAANRHKGIRAALAWDTHEAKLTRNDNDSNILCLPSRALTNKKEVEDIVNTWLETPFANAPRYIRRNKQLDNLG